MKELRRKNQPDTASIEAARKIFLDAYARETPDILAGLLETVSPPYAQNTESPIYNLWGVVLHTDAALAAALSEWAQAYLLLLGGKPVWWAMDTALETLRTWRESIHRPFVCLKWHHPPEFHDSFLTGDPEYFSSTGESEAEQLADELAIQFAIRRWDRPNGETLRQFKDRFEATCKRVYKEHVQEAKAWTERPGLTEFLYADGLAMWQAGRELSEIHKALETRDLHVGQHPTDSDYDSAISKGLTRMAKLIQLDRRPARNRKRTAHF